jgi:hypothetical protein
MSQAQPSEETLYKTELCRSNEQGHCAYGEKCQFAHGIEELRTAHRPHNYKTKHCKSFSSNGRCAYGIRCRFIHSLDKAIDIASGLQARKFPSKKATPFEDSLESPFEIIRAEQASRDIIQHRIASPAFRQSASSHFGGNAISLPRSPSQPQELPSRHSGAFQYALPSEQSLSMQQQPAATIPTHQEGFYPQQIRNKIAVPDGWLDGAVNKMTQPQVKSYSFLDSEEDNGDDLQPGYESPTLDKSFFSMTIRERMYQHPQVSEFFAPGALQAPPSSLAGYSSFFVD